MGEYLNLSNYIIQADGMVFNIKRNRYQYIQRCKLGYCRCWLTDDFGKRKAYMVHRLVAELYVKGQTHQKTDVNHKDGIKVNNHYENLEWVTKSENQKHAYDNGLNPSKKGMKYKKKSR